MWPLPREKNRNLNWGGDGKDTGKQTHSVDVEARMTLIDFKWIVKERERSQGYLLGAYWLEYLE